MTPAVLAALAALQLAAADSLPRLTLSEALARATRLDPDYVQSLGLVDNAEWGRRAALSALVLPSMNLTSDYSRFSVAQFNVGTGQPAGANATLRVDGRFELFAGGRKAAEVARSGAELEGAHAGEVQQRYLTALLVEAEFYNVLSGRELLDVARDRLRRATEQLVVARARVASGAAVQTDSLQVLLEQSRARIALLLEETRFEVARLQLGRRVGLSRGADAVPVDSAPAPALPLTLPDAIQTALLQGPDYRVVRASERQAAALLRQRRAAYLPQVVLTANYSQFGDQWVPDGLSRRSVVFQASFPLWDNLQRELNLTRARTARDAARAVREDIERGAEADVTEAYRAYETARASAEIARTAVIVARESYRVQDARYRAGATTVLDLLEAQSSLTEAQAVLVQASYATRLALAGLEAMLGRRLFTEDQP